MTDLEEVRYWAAEARRLDGEAARLRRKAQIGAVVALVLVGLIGVLLVVKAVMGW